MFWIFLFSGIIANLVSGFFFYLAKDATPALGASGGIAGLIILSILLEPFTITFAFLIPLPLFIVGWFGILNDIIGLLYSDPNSNINHLAHISGYASLLILLFFLNYKNKKKVLIGLVLNILILIITYLLLNNFGLGLSNIISLIYK